MLNRVLVAALILILVLPLAGCWNRRELNTLGIIGLVGVDASDSGIKATFEVIKPEKSSKGGEKTEVPVKYVEASGQTLVEAFRSATPRFDRKLFVSHAKEVLFSEELARRGLAEYLDMILRDHEMRLSMHLAIVKDSPVTEVMGISGGVNTIPANYIEDLLKQYKVHSKSVDSKVIDFLRAYESKGKNPVLSVVRKVKKEKTGAGKKEEYELSVEGAAVFLRDRLVGFLDGEETMVYNLVINKAYSGIITFPDPNSNGITSIEILKAVSTMDVDINDGEIKLRVKQNIDGMLDEELIPATIEGKLTNSAVIQRMEQAASESIKHKVEQALLKVQQVYKSDIYGFGQVVHQKYPQQWKDMQDNWDELFATAAVEVEVSTKITKTGKSSNPVRE
jgi:spore germination protein KC